MSETQSFESPREELIHLLKTHDWHYGYSDDPRSYTRGQKQITRIRQLMEQVPDGQELYLAHRPATASY